MKEYTPAQFRGNLQAFSISSAISQKQKARKYSAWVAMQGKENMFADYFYELFLKSLFFQSRFSAFFLVSLCKKFLYTCKNQRPGVADTAKGYSIYLDSA